MMLLRTPLRASDNHTVRSPDHQPAGLSEKAASGLSFQRRPQVICALCQRHIKRMLEVGFTDDARSAVRRTNSVRRLEAVEPKCLLAAPGEMIAGRAAHGPQPDDDDLKIFQPSTSRKTVLQM